MGILQARILGWVAMPSSMGGGSSQPRDWTPVSRIAGGLFTTWATREAHKYCSGWPIPSLGDLPDPGIKPGSPALQVDSLPPELWGKISKPNLTPSRWTKELVCSCSCVEKKMEQIIKAHHFLKATELNAVNETATDVKMEKFMISTLKSNTSSF